jgi:sulfur-carrier protein adenylyltransferase/sulfurtransferase
MPSTTSIHAITPTGLGSLPSSTRRIDVREPAEFEGMLGRLPGSELVPLGTLPAAAESWPRAQPLLLICRSGGRSMMAARMLAEQGFTTLHNLEGGMLAVRESGLAVEGPGRDVRLSAGQVRDSLCAAVRELYGQLTPPPCETLFEAPSAFPRPDRQALHQALDRMGGRARADGLAAEAIERTLRKLQDLLAVIDEQGKGVS